jgi:hypothetical protein
MVPRKSLMICPFLVKTVVYETGKRPIHSKFHCIYATKETTLQDIRSSLEEERAIMKPKKLVFRAVFGATPRMKKRGLGVLYDDKKSEDEEKSLDTLGFRIGDLLEVETYREDPFEGEDRLNRKRAQEWGESESKRKKRPSEKIQSKERND